MPHEKSKSENHKRILEDPHTLCMQNRELSWLVFNERVLEEACWSASPLLERWKFVSIFTTNLDEFFRVRVGSLVDCELYDPEYFDNKTGMTAAQQLQAIYARTAKLYAYRDKIVSELNTELKKLDIVHVSFKRLSESARKYVDKYFRNNILPFLSPQIIDNRHLFPHIDNKQINVAVMLQQKENKLFGIIPLPASISRIVVLPEGQLHYITAEEIILGYCEEIFSIYEVTEKTVLCVTRNADINTDVGLADEDFDYRQHMKKLIKKRARLAPVRVEVQSRISHAFTEYLCTKFNLPKEAIFTSKTSLDLSYIFSLDSKLPPHLRGELVVADHVPQPSAELSLNQSIIEQVSKKDVLLSYPFESMQPFIQLIKEASESPEVVSIRITLYRIAKQSKLAEYLIRAVENGKDVTVLMELRARFDEENNIDWAQRFEEAGCKVLYGPDGFKVHSKICLITMKKEDGYRYITQIGTGNYNEKTAKLYTDLSLITANEQIGNDADVFFKNMLVTNLNGSYERLWIAPYSLKSNIIAAMDKEIEKARNDKPAAIVIKCNSLTDRDVILKLIEASQAGVKVSLVVRGICCLRPGVPGYTENITVLSIVGRFLEHSRIYCFGTDDDVRLFISSADMMTRNTERRVEIAAPILDPALKKRVLGMLHAILTDNVKARRLRTDGKYIQRKPTEDYSMNSQEYFIKTAERLATAAMLRLNTEEAQEPKPPKAKKVAIRRVKKNP